MHSTLIIYSTTDGQTKLICEKIKKSLISSEQTKIVSLKEVHRESLESFDKIVILLILINCGDSYHIVLII